MPGSGRLSAAGRRATLLQTAEAVFLDRGFHIATMNDIARQAGMSKKTIYQLFPGKASLFEALLADRLRILPAVIENDGRALRAVLIDALCRAVEHALTERQIALFRLMVADAAGPTDALTPWERSGVVGQSSAALAQWLAAEAEKGTLRVDNPVEAASWLFWSAAGKFTFQALLDKRAGPTRETIERQVRRTVDAFLLEARTG